MKQSLIFWIIAVLVTAVTLIYQRITGPTYPISGKIILNGKEIKYKLERTHPGPTNHTVKIEIQNQNIIGTVAWKRHNTSDEWTLVPMVYRNGALTAELSHQPPAGKLDYHVTLQDGSESVDFPDNKPVVIRYRGDVPAIVLIVHVFAMFVGLLLSTRAGFECFAKEPHLKKFTLWTIIFLALGGLIMGPMMQWYAFGAWWTGWPFGIDLTDNKTAIALFFWILAAIVLKRAKNPQRWALAAAVITIMVYLIPHSVLGSELDYSKVNPQTVSSTTK